MRIRKLSPSQKFQGYLAVRNVILKQGAGGPFLDLRLWDGEAEAPGRVWGFDGQPPRLIRFCGSKGKWGSTTVNSN